MLQLLLYSSVWYKKPSDTKSFFLQSYKSIIANDNMFACTVHWNYSCGDYKTPGIEWLFQMFNPWCHSLKGLSFQQIFNITVLNSIVSEILVCINKPQSFTNLESVLGSTTGCPHREQSSMKEKS